MRQQAMTAAAAGTAAVVVVAATVAAAPGTGPVYSSRGKARGVASEEVLSWVQHQSVDVHKGSARVVQLQRIEEGERVGWSGRLSQQL